MARVLIIEDRPEIQTLIRAVVTRSGHEASVAADGDQARGLLVPRPDLIFIDLGLPGESGIDLIRDIRTRPGLDGVPVVIVTAHPDGAKQLSQAQLRAVELVAKPFRFDQLAEILSRHLGHAGL